MLYFKKKPIKDWTLAEAKEYCKNVTHCDGKNCILRKTNNCIGIFANMELKDNTIPQFSPDEIAFFRLIKKIYPWAEYIVRGESGGLRLFEKDPIVDGILCDRPNSKTVVLNDSFFPQIELLSSYAIDDIIK